MVQDIRHYSGECLVDINASAERDHRDDQDGVEPKDVAELHVMSLTEPLSPTLSPSGRGGCQPNRHPQPSPLQVEGDADRTPLPFRERETLAAEPDAGIPRVVVDANLEMQMWPGRPPRGPFVTDPVPAGDDLPARKTARV